MSDDKFLVDVRQQKSDIYDPIVWEQMKGMAETFIKSGALPQGENAARLMMKMQAGREMGMKPVESIKSFYFVNGTLNIFGAALARRIREHGWVIRFIDEVNKCTAVICKGDEKYTDSLTFEEAEKSGWTKTSSGLKPGWREGVNRKLKLRYGVLSSMIKTYLPEVLGSATDIAEVAMDTAPLYESTEAQVINEGDNDPVTTKQLEYLRTLKIEIPDNLTKGQAKQMIVEATKKGGK